jgi:hypothetical protein
MNKELTKKLFKKYPKIFAKRTFRSRKAPWAGGSNAGMDGIGLLTAFARLCHGKNPDNSMIMELRGQER